MSAGHQLHQIENPDLMVLVSIPLIIGFIIVLSYNIIITKIFKLKYKEAIITVIIGSSSHFEIAIATATTMFGIGVCVMPIGIYIAGAGLGLWQLSFGKSQFYFLI